MVPVREAATVLLVRDGPGDADSCRSTGRPGASLEVLVLRRNPLTVFSPGASVFPGGAVDEADDRPVSLSRVVGIDGRAADRAAGGPGRGLALRVAAVRECFEEAGILLGRDRRGEAVDPAAPPSSERFDGWRAALNDRSTTWADFVEAEDIFIDGRDLSPFAHFITPVGAPRRYDTWFFVAAAPTGQRAVHDDSEAVESAWVRPRDALARYGRGEIDLIYPTMRSLEVLDRFATAAEALRAVRSVRCDSQGRPWVLADGFGERVVLPGDDAAPRPWTIPLVTDPEIRRAVEAWMPDATVGGGA